QQDQGTVLADAAHVQVAATAIVEQANCARLRGSGIEELRQGIELFGNGAAWFEHCQLKWSDTGYGCRCRHAVCHPDASTGYLDFFQILRIALCLYVRTEVDCGGNGNCYRTEFELRQ